MTDTAPSPPRWTEDQAVADLVPAVRNAKDHDQAALGASVREFGFIEPVVLDERTGRLLAGHGRVEHLTELQAQGAEPPDGVVVGEDGRWQWLVVRGIASRDDAHADAMAIALNRVGERGGWRADVLSDVLDGLFGSDLAAATGWTADELDDLIAATGGGELADQGTDAEHAPYTPRGEPQTPREVQGIREVGLMMAADLHREYLEHLAKLRRAWATDAAPAVVVRALREAAERAE
jgi:hypothetical protein